MFFSCMSRTRSPWQSSPERPGSPPGPFNAGTSSTEKAASQALDPHARTDKGARRTSAETVTFIEQLALTRRRPSIATLHRLAVTHATVRELPAPSYATVRQIVHALNPALVTLALEGPVSYRDKHELVFRRRAEHPNQTWQSDHTELDIHIVGADEKPDRPWLTTVMDDYSRAICGYMVFTGAPSAINRVLKINLLDTITDNVIEAAASLVIGN